MIKDKMMQYIQSKKDELVRLSDTIFDNPEIALQEHKTCALLSDYLEAQGFTVERGVGGLETAFRASWSRGEGGPTIGFVAEYDALPEMGHACGHHTEGPIVAAAAMALKEFVDDRPFTVVVYGCPAEEIGLGKVVMLENGCFKELDCAIAIHMDALTAVDVHKMALRQYDVTFHGVPAHAAIRPEEGKSALDALLLTFQGLEFLREHVIDDVRMHYTVTNAGGPANVTPAKATGNFLLRSYNSTFLKEVVRRFEMIVQGAALMSDTTYDIVLKQALESNIPVFKLHDAIMKNAEFAGAPDISPPREKTGSNDFGPVARTVPGACLRFGFLPHKSAAPHSMAFYEAGKTERTHDAIVNAAQTLACSGYDLIADPDLLTEIRREFEENKRLEEESVKRG